MADIQLTPEEQGLLGGAPASKAAGAGESAPPATTLSPDEAAILAPQTPPKPSPLPPAAPAATPPSSFTEALVSPDDAVAQTISPTGPLVPIPQTEAGAPGILPGVSHGLREAVNPLLEAGSRAGNWLADKTGWNALRTNRVANDLASEQAFQQQYGGLDPVSQAAQGTAGVTRFVAPLVAGGAVGKGIELGAEAAGAPTLGSFLTGTGGVGQTGFGGWANRLASGAATGGVQGMLTGGPQGAVVGAVTGGTVAPAAGAITNWATQRFGGGAIPALQKIAQAVDRDGMTPRDLDNAVGALGPLATVADVEASPNVRQLAVGVANTPGPGQAVAARFLGARNEGQTQRLDDAVKTATGATGTAFGNMQDLQQARQAAAGPAYQNAFNNTVVWSDDAQKLSRFVDTPIGQRALADGIADARMRSIADGTPFSLGDYGVSQAADGSLSLNPWQANLRGYDAVKRGYDRLAESFRDPTSGRLNLSGTMSVPGLGNVSGSALQDVRQAYTGQLRQLFPDYATALDAWGGPSADMDALTMGRRVLSGDADATADAVSRLSPSQKQMYQVGVAQALGDKIAATPDDADATRRIFGNDLIRRKIAAGFGGESTPAFQNFAATMDREATFAQTYRQAYSGSPTAYRTAAIGLANQPAPGPNLVSPLLHLAQGNVPGAAIDLGHQTVAPLLNWVRRPSDRYNFALGNYLYNPASQQDLINALRSGVPPSVRDRLLGWPGAQGVQALTDPRRYQGGGQ